MRILHINTINQVANLHARGLDCLGHTSTVVQPSVVGGLAPRPLKLALMPWRLLDMVRLEGRLSPRHYDVAHIHWGTYGALGLLSRIPYVVQCHGTDVRRRLAMPWYRALFQRIAARAGAILCTTPDLLSVVRDVYPLARFMPGPIDTELFVPATERADGQRPWTIFLFSRLEPGKQVDAAAAGIARFARRHPAVRVRLLDWGEQSLEFRSRYGDRFEFVPRVAPVEVPRLLHEADVVVGQFGIGALTLSELQAMSCGKPTITSFRFGSEYASEPPLVNVPIAERFEEIIEEHLERLYEEPQLGAALGAQAREWVVAHHSIDIVATRLDALYREILSHPGTSREQLGAGRRRGHAAAELGTRR